MAVPLDDIEAAWLQLDGRWAVRIAGALEPGVVYFSSPGEEHLIYVPPGTASGSPLAGHARDAAQAIVDVATQTKVEDGLKGIAKEIALGQPPIEAVEGRRVVGVSRLGKRVVLKLLPCSETAGWARQTRAAVPTASRFLPTGPDLPSHGASPFHFQEIFHDPP